MDDDVPTAGDAPDDTPDGFDAALELMGLGESTDDLRLRWDAPERDDLFWLALEIVEPLSADATGWTARQWWEAFGNALVEGALADGARDFDVRFLPWGVVFEVGFRSESEVADFRDRVSVRAALDQLGELGFAFSFGRQGGGGAGARRGRAPRPLVGAGSAALPVPEPDVVPDAQPAAVPVFI